VACFWRDFVGCHEECAPDDCGEEFAGDEVYAIGTGRAVPEGLGVFAFVEGVGDSLILDFSGLGETSFATIRSGKAKLPTADCTSGCCLLVGGSTGVPPDYEFDADPDFEAEYHDIGEVAMAPVDGEPGKFAVPLSELFLDIDSAPFGGMASINVETQLGMFCDIRTTLEYCH